ncbi:MAG: hypothetical protein SVR94_18620 [Pseudomonadota bacterium]|nr:hypothetical protein [Pseudomonadota bacterium]
MIDLKKLCAIVQQNCHISDGLYAQDYGLCTYLMKMRELYRWEHSLPLTASLPQADIGKWLTAREQLWAQLTEESFACLPVHHHCFDPFEATAINQLLIPQGMVYGGGYGQFCKPLFFIALLYQHQQRQGVDIIIADKEYARDLTAPAAMTQGNTIFIRRESLRRLLWERIEEWRWQKAQNPVQQQLESYWREQDLETTLDELRDREVETLIDHELGEIQAGQLLGHQWEQMLLALAGHQAELLARAVRDHLADCLVTLPRLLAQQHPFSLLFYFSNLKGLRKTVFPALVNAFQQWLADSHQLESLAAVVRQGQDHWLATAQSFLALYAADPQHSPVLISQQKQYIIQ